MAAAPSELGEGVWLIEHPDERRFALVADAGVTQIQPPLECAVALQRRGEVLAALVTDAVVTRIQLIEWRVLWLCSALARCSQPLSNGVHESAGHSSWRRIQTLHGYITIALYCTRP